MGKKFNITGLCIPERHYMVDISGRVAEIRKMVKDGEYFTINRPRQYGKTTTLNCLSWALAGEYAVIDTSFEGTGDSMFATEEAFCSQIFEVFANSMRFSDGILSSLLLKYQDKIYDFKSLSTEISNLIIELEKGIVLLIDEVDKSSDNKVFLRFLGMLRNKYLAHAAGKDVTFQSVVLAGVHDVKNLKLAIRGESDVLEGGGGRFNSPWNIAVKFKIDMSFSVPDIEAMLAEYREDNSLDFDIAEIAAETRKLTSGYPYLVSGICQIIDEDLHRDWTLVGVENAAKQILKEKSTLFDDVIKNIENNKEIKNTVIAMLFEGKSVEYNPDTYEQGILYGIFIEKNGKLAIHNQLFEERLYAYLISQHNVRQLADSLLSVEQSQFTETGRLDMEKVLRKFREFMREEYRRKDDKFYETNGRLLFLAYLRPIINGRGFALVEPETRDNKRMDIVVTYGDEKFIIELKIWHGTEYEQKGLSQLAGYLDIQSMDVGWLITFGLGKMVDAVPEWVKAYGKDIFKVIV
jgi:hypothetical protein